MRFRATPGGRFEAMPRAPNVWVLRERGVGVEEKEFYILSKDLPRSFKPWSSAAQLAAADDVFAKGRLSPAPPHARQRRACHRLEHRLTTHLSPTEAAQRRALPAIHLPIAALFPASLPWAAGRDAGLIGSDARVVRKIAASFTSQPSRSASQTTCRTLTRTGCSGISEKRKRNALGRLFAAHDRREAEMEATLRFRRRSPSAPSHFEAPTAEQLELYAAGTLRKIALQHRSHAYE